MLLENRKLSKKLKRGLFKEKFTDGRKYCRLFCGFIKKENNIEELSLDSRRGVIQL